MVTIEEQMIVVRMKGGQEDLNGLIHSLLAVLGSQDENTMLNSTETYHITSLIRELLPDIADPAFKLPPPRKKKDY
ncbi:MAG: hypothetical protein LCH54_15685 [Bacteroidetes bacterium]|nr:hypothetical protein [Bacteroidota bacterium]